MGYFFSVFFGTFVLEDVALASALTLVSGGKIDVVVAFFACFLGIGLGDLGLYLIGFSLGQLGMEDRFKTIRKFRRTLGNDKSSNLLTYSIIISRFVPGTRFPTYLTAGLLRYSFFRFTLLTAVTVFLWVFLAFAFGHSLQPLLMNHWVLTLLASLVFLSVFKFLITKLSDTWERKALLHSWRRWTSFEFWPSWFFYIPIIPYYFFLSIRHRSFLTPFYASPNLKNGGLIGESKWDFLKHLDPSDSHTLNAIKIKNQTDFIQAKNLLEQEGFSYPFILKPDVGQRGFGVRIIRDDFDLTEYLLLADFDMIVQKLSTLPGEAGVFYVRYPNEKQGFIFSITDKRFPSVVGDGHTPLGDLILQDRRARIIAPVYFSRHRAELNSVPEDRKPVFLSECGNHCQGAIFLNGKALSTVALQNSIHRIASRIPHFYFGRIDLRYKDRESFMSGNDFEIVEINGAGSEATHIWDANTTLLEAYKTLFIQWKMLFEIGASVRSQGIQPTDLKVWSFLKECIKVVKRKESLSVSS